MGEIDMGEIELSTFLRLLNGCTWEGKLCVSCAGQGFERV